MTKTACLLTLTITVLAACDSDTAGILITDASAIDPENGGQGPEDGGQGPEDGGRRSETTDTSIFATPQPRDSGLRSETTDTNAEPMMPRSEDGGQGSETGSASTADARPMTQEYKDGGHGSETGSASTADARPMTQEYKDGGHGSEASPGSQGAGQLGSACNSAFGCISGFCVSGVCCESACQRQGPETCGRTGRCLPSGRCQMYPEMVVCTPATCKAPNIVVPAKRCDGAGACRVVDYERSCGSFVCSEGACKTYCTGPSDCTPGGTCWGGKCSFSSAPLCSMNAGRGVCPNPTTTVCIGIANGDPGDLPGTCASCGGKEQPCCPDGSCAAGLNCHAQRICL